MDHLISHSHSQSTYHPPRQSHSTTYHPAKPTSPSHLHHDHDAFVILNDETLFHPSKDADKITKNPITELKAVAQDGLEKVKRHSKRGFARVRTRVEIGVADIKFLGQREERKNVRRFTISFHSSKHSLQSSSKSIPSTTPASTIMSQLPRTLSQVTHGLDIARIALYFAKLSVSRSEKTYARRVQRFIDDKCSGIDLTHPQIIYEMDEGRRGMRRRRDRRARKIEREVRGLVEMMGRLKRELREVKEEGEGLEAEVEVEVEVRKDEGVL